MKGPGPRPASTCGIWVPRLANMRKGQRALSLAGPGCGALMCFIWLSRLRSYGLWGLWLVLMLRRLCTPCVAEMGDPGSGWLWRLQSRPMGWMVRPDWDRCHRHVTMSPFRLRAAALLSPGSDDQRRRQDRYGPRAHHRDQCQIPQVSLPIFCLIAAIVRSTPLENCLRAVGKAVTFSVGYPEWPRPHQ